MCQYKAMHYCVEIKPPYKLKIGMGFFDQAIQSKFKLYFNKHGLNLEIRTRKYFCTTLKNLTPHMLPLRIARHI